MRYNNFQNNKLPSWLLIWLIILSATLAWLIVILLDDDSLQWDQTGVKAHRVVLEKEEINFDVEQLPVVLNRKGVIIDFNKNSFFIESAKLDDFSEVEKIEINYNNNTKFIQVSIQTRLSENLAQQLSNGQSIYKRQVISLDDLQLGDKVITLSEKNIRGKISFLASKIEKEILQ